MRTTWLVPTLICGLLTASIALYTVSAIKEPIKFKFSFPEMKPGEKITSVLAEDADGTLYEMDIACPKGSDKNCTEAYFGWIYKSNSLL